MHFALVSSALIASLVGFAGTLALIVAAAQAVGATPAQTVSWITAISLVKALEAGYLSLRYRMPIVTAWSTPGAALIGASVGIALDAAARTYLNSANPEPRFFSTEEEPAAARAGAPMTAQQQVE